MVDNTAKMAIMSLQDMLEDTAQLRCFTSKLDDSNLREDFENLKQSIVATINRLDLYV